jgi:predicted alpha-1,2-mannosidase
MKKNYQKLSILFTAAVLFQLLSCSQQTRKPVDYVNPFISTEGDHGHWHPSALVPFGLVKLGPDTYPGSLTGDGDFAHSGYNYSDSIIRGFSHFHKGSSGGTSISDRAGRLAIMPFTGEPVDSFYLNPLAVINKKSEKASPGYYSVTFKDDNICTELTTTPHVGIHKYTFPEGKSARIFINEGNKRRSTDLSVHQIDNYHLEGFQSTFSGVHFVVEFDHPIVSVNKWNGTELEKGNSLVRQEDGGLICNFGNLDGEPLLVKVGVSLTSLEAAKNNLKAECTTWDFQEIRQDNADLWNDRLDVIDVEGDEEYKTIFYTALYHTCFLPVVLSDVDDTYPGMDKEIHESKGYKHYNDYAFWDSFRTKYPLYSLFVPDVYRDIVKSLRDIYEQSDNCAPYPGSDHPPHGHDFKYKGIDGYQSYSTCRHEHMIMVMTDAYFKNLYDIDIKKVYPYIKREVMVQMPEKYDSIGYIPARPDQTGEYSWDNWCLAQVAKDIGNQDDYKYFTKRSQYWKNTWNPENLFFQARAADKTWLDFPDDPSVNREKYTYEGSAWHYRWNILHDVPSLIEAFNGKEKFLKELNYFFDHDLYTAGNQIDLHVPFFFNYAGAPWQTQKWVTKILTEPILQKYGTHNFFPEPIFDRVYKNAPDGFLEEMDGDYGCMSAWYALSAMGLYQICPGNPVYQLTSPIFEKISIKLDENIYKGKRFVIKANGLSKQNYYIQSATLNGEILNRCWLSHNEITAGGELIFEMGSKPNKNWGIASVN